MKKTLTGISLLALSIFVPHIAAQTQANPDDAEGCKDSPLVSRFPGSTIGGCDHKEFEQATMHVGKDKDGNTTEKTLEGEYFNWTYGAREGLSQIQLFRNFETALTRGGFTLVYEDSPSEITARKANTWIKLETNTHADGYEQTIVTTKEMNQEVTADASALADELAKSGHVAVYGIHFDTGKATILADSEGTLQQIAQLLGQDPELKLLVEGYTDNVGSAASNQGLSERRAQAVVAWLTAHSVDRSRLAAKGLGQSNPVAENSTDEGRARNRRVELVKM